MQPSVELVILQWNVLFGLLSDTHRLNSFETFVRNGGYNVVGLNELNGFSEASLSAVGHRCGLDYSVLVPASSGFHVGLMSKYPILNVRRLHGSPMWHALLLAEIEGVTFVIVHLSPESPQWRKSEIHEVLKLLPSGTPWLMMGDMNTLSPHDRSDHVATGLVERLQETEGLRRKFLRDGRSIDYEPMEMLLSVPMVDLAIPTSAGQENDMHSAISDDAVAGDVGAIAPASGVAAAAAARRVFEYTVPTPGSIDESHKVPLRIDYMLASPALVDRCARISPVRTLTGGVLDTVSDHFPITSSLVLDTLLSTAREEL